MENLNKVCRLGKIKELGSVFVEIKIRDSEKGLRLSILGVEGPRKSGNCKGSSGQIDLDTQKFDSFAKGWDVKSVKKLKNIWHRWHLNDMKSGCEHQRSEEWDKRPIDPEKPLNAYGKHFPGQTMASWNMLAWVRRDEHPEGLLGYPCPTCGYGYGTEWLYETLHQDVIDWLHQLPETDIPYPWNK